MNYPTQKRALPTSADAVPGMERALGIVQRVDTVGREITLLLATGSVVFEVAPDCLIFLRGERIKLRMVQPRDEAKVIFTKSGELLIAHRFDVQPDRAYPH